jgi:protein-S-isoprenylcysteine O-methyltransferase Ste14
MAEERPKKKDRMRRVLAVLGTIVYLLIVPLPVAGIVPWWMSRWRMEAPLLGFAPFRVVGIVLMAMGVIVLLDSFTRFAIQGLGTPAPLFPTRRLIVKGFYRYVRNPTYLSVLSVILGEGLYLGDVRVLVYILFPWLMVYLFVRIDEEPTLRRSYGDQYERYCAHVRRWWPRLTPWREGMD